MTLRQGLNQVGEKPLPLGVCRNSSISVSTQSSFHKEELSFLLRWEPTIRSPEKLEIRWSFSLYLLLLSPFSFFSFLLPPISFSTELFGPKSSGMSSLPHVNILLALFRFPLSIYPKLWIFILLGGDTCPTWAPLRLLFDLLFI